MSVRLCPGLCGEKRRGRMRTVRSVLSARLLRYTAACVCLAITLLLYYAYLNSLYLVDEGVFVWMGMRVNEKGLFANHKLSQPMMCVDPKNMPWTTSLP
jgi:hypothetical protein